MADDVFELNRRVWDARVERGNPWTLAGFVVTGFHEDAYSPEEGALFRFIPSFIATRARKAGA